MTNDVWLTPLPIINALGGAESFDLDPATPPVQPWATAKARYTEADDGLALPWFGRVWLNPPYSAGLYGRFMRRMVEHGHGVALVPAKTETAVFFGSVWERAAGLLFIRGRITFHTPDGQAAGDRGRFPSVLVAYGADDAERLAFSGLDGQFVALQLPRFVLGAYLDGETWREVVAGWMRDQRGPVRLDDLYRALARHPKTTGRSNWRAKVRQTLKRGAGRRVGPALWVA